MDFTSISPDYSTTPEQRLSAHLERDLRRHLPHAEFDSWGLARRLAGEFSKVARGVRLEDYPARHEVA